MTSGARQQDYNNSEHYKLALSTVWDYNLYDDNALVKKGLAPPLIAAFL